MSPRVQAVIDAMTKVEKVIEDEDFHDLLLAQILRKDPDYVWKQIERKTVPRWVLDLFIAVKHSSADSVGFSNTRHILCPNS